MLGSLVFLSFSLMFLYQYQRFAYKSIVVLHKNTLFRFFTFLTFHTFCGDSRPQIWSGGQTATSGTLATFVQSQEKAFMRAELPWAPCTHTFTRFASVLCCDLLCSTLLYSAVLGCALLCCASAVLCCPSVSDKEIRGKVSLSSSCNDQILLPTRRLVESCPVLLHKKNEEERRRAFLVPHTQRCVERFNRVLPRLPTRRMNREFCAPTYYTE